MCAGLYEKLADHGAGDYAAFHMPGHKRQKCGGAEGFLPEGLPWQIDITEIDGFDNLHHAEGILRDSMERAAAWYGVRRSFFSVNGSTAGLLSALSAALQPCDTVLMGRNCHKAAYHAVFLRNLRPLYVYPQIDRCSGIACGYDMADIREMVENHPEIRAVVLTSPTYEGAVSDIRAIAAYLHEHGIPLIVDEAHGAHLSVGRRREFKEIFPLSAVCQGADIVIQSLHKTLPALTQTAIVHVSGELVNPDEVARYMGIYQTSSPSYVLMASIDACLRYMSSPEGQEKRAEYEIRLTELRNSMRGYRHIHLPEIPHGEPSKLVLLADGMTGRELYDCLRLRYHIQGEMCTSRYALLMTSMADTDEMYKRLRSALTEIDAGLERAADGVLEQTPEDDLAVPFHGPQQRYTPAQADALPREEIALSEAEGRVSAEYAYHYPPGIPLLVPGEVISAEALRCLRREAGAGIQGLRDMTGQRILVLRERLSSGKERQEEQ